MSENPIKPHDPKEPHRMFGDPTIGEGASLNERMSYARAVRSRTAKLGEAMKEGTIDWEDVVVGHPNDTIAAFVSNLRVVTLLPKIPGIGSAATQAIMSSMGLANSTRMFSLSDERRRELAYFIRGWSARHPSPAAKRDDSAPPDHA